MRLPSPIDVHPTTSRSRPLVIGLGVALVVAVGVFVVTRGDDEPTATGADDPAEGGSDGADRNQGVGVSDLGLLAAPVRLVDTRPDAETVDGEFESAGPVAAGTPLEIPVAGRGGAPDSPGLAVLTTTATAGDAPSEISVSPCGSPADPVTSVRVAAGATTTRTLLVPVGGNGAVCVVSSARVDLVVDFAGSVDAAGVRPFPGPVRLLDTRASGATDDGRFAGTGVRPQDSTVRVPVASRFTGLGDVGALVVSITAAAPLDDGELSVFAPAATVPPPPLFGYTADVTNRGVDIVPIGPTGELCVSTTGRTDLIVEILALVPSSGGNPALTAAGDVECPGQTFFPDRRIVALYGTQRSARLGVLGEQSPAESVARLDEIAEPWRAGDRPVMEAFELIATLATGTPEDRGVYNIRSSPEFVQEYLDVARRHGYYLILDLQPGQSDFLTEAKYYEEFLRQPDVGIALDPEWRTAAPARPKGGFVGQVDAAEVNSVIDYVAQLVEEEHLPEKLVVVHQFQERMITNKAQLVERPGVALTIHMDGFGSRAEKLNSYSIVRVEPPINMGLKLFFDEDIDRYDAATVLGGEFDPVPDLITYQ
ncbi:MAG: hypothetical protein ABIP17_16375 [Ilumatobacteraceae bacterium]